MKKHLKLPFNILFIFLFIIIVGYTSMDYSFATKSSIFIISVCIIPILYYLITKKIINKYIITLPLFVYFISTVISWKLLFNPILPSLLTSSFVLFKSKKHIIIVTSLILSFIISFYIYPYEYLQSKKTQIAPHRLEKFLFIDSTRLKLKDNDCIIIETWGKGCGQCFFAMKDLEQFFHKLEKEYHLQHEYIYIGQLSNTEKKLFKSYNYLLNQDTLFQDTSQAYYKKTKMDGYPYFNLYDSNKKYMMSFYGYDKRFKSEYKKAFSNFVADNCPKR